MKSTIIAKYTLREILKSRILYVSLFLGFCIFTLSFIGKEFTYGVPHRVALDFGLGLLSLSSVGISVFFGASLISREVESRTVYMVLSRPVTRVEFLFGKILGLLSFILINSVILSAFSLFIYILTNQSIFDVTSLWAILFIIIEAVIVLLITLNLSLVTNLPLTVVGSIFIYMLGHVLTNTTMLTFVKNNYLLEKVLSVYSTFFPNFSRLNIKDFVLYNESLNLSFYLSNLVYGVCYSIALFVLLVFIFNKKELT